MRNIKEGPLVSVIIPTLNRCRTIRRAIDSVLMQTYTNLELLVIDNCSDDNTDQIISSYHDKRVKYLKNPIRHLSVSRNMGIDHSNGKLIALLDSDDWWLKSKLAESVRAINLGYDIIYHDLIKYNPNQSLVHRLNINNKLKSRQLKGKAFDDLYLNSNAINVSSVVFKKSLYKKCNGFSELNAYRNCEDYEYWLRISTYTNKFFRLSKALGFYEIANDSMRSHNMRVIAYKKILSQYNKYLKIKKLPGHIYSSIAISYFSLKEYKKAGLWSIYCLTKTTNLIPRIKSLIVLLTLQLVKLKYFLMAIYSNKSRY